MSRVDNVSSFFQSNHFSCLPCLCPVLCPVYLLQVLGCGLLSASVLPPYVPKSLEKVSEYFISLLCDKCGRCSHPRPTGQQTEPEGLTAQPAQHTLLLDSAVSPAGLDSPSVAPAAPKMSRLVQATLAFMVMTIITSLLALFVVGKLLGNLNPTDSLLTA